MSGPLTPPLTLIIRFASAIPDLLIPIPSPSTTNAASLRTLIRPQLPLNLSTCPLRLIHNGALLPASKSLSTSLRLSTQPPPNGSSAQPPLPPQQLYIHCSIATETSLTLAELEAEARAGTLHSSPTTAPTNDSKSYDTSEDAESQDENEARPDGRAADSVTDGSNIDRRGRRARRHDGDTTSDAAASSPPPPPPPQGFDRLLAAGLTPAEVASLRSSFLAIQAHTHTPDTMPTASELRALEERWLDSTSNGGGGGGGGADVLGGEGGGAAGGFVDDTEAGGLEDMLWGNVMGFFWAVGAIVWLVREEGVWSKRRQIGVVTGVLVNLAFCFLRVGG